MSHNAPYLRHLFPDSPFYLYATTIPAADGRVNRRVAELLAGEREQNFATL